jgi:hypothetical protein
MIPNPFFKALLIVSALFPAGRQAPAHGFEEPVSLLTMPSVTEPLSLLLAGAGLVLLGIGRRGK